MSALRITVLDEDGNTVTHDVPDNDYWIVTTGSCDVTGIQVHKGGATHVLTIKGRAADLNTLNAREVGR